MPMPRQSSFSRTNSRPCPTNIKKPEWDAGQQDLAHLTAALAQAHTQVADLDDRLKASVAAEREASARSNQQAMSLAELSAHLQQQLDSSRANDERISQSLRQRQWTEAQIATLNIPVQSVITVGCAGEQRIIIVHEPSGTNVSGHGQYQSHVCRVW